MLQLSRKLLLSTSIGNVSQEWLGRSVRDRQPLFGYISYAPFPPDYTK